MRKSIVVYYTWAGHTRKMAQIIAGQTGAELLEIMPQAPYTTDYNAVVNQAKEEIRRGYHPPIQHGEVDLSSYDTVYLGSPIWWGTMAPPVMTFLGEHDFDGKTILPFTTHGGGGKGHSDRDVAKACPGAQVLEMYTAYEGGGRNADKEISAWIKQNRRD